MRWSVILMCLVMGVAQGQTTQPTTLPSYNGPKIARELRERIAALEAEIENLSEQLKAATTENERLQKALLAMQDREAAEGKKGKTAEIEAAIRAKEIVRGMTMEHCREATGSKGSRILQNSDGSETWKFVTYKNAQKGTTTFEWEATLKDGVVIAVYVSSSYAPTPRPQLIPR